MQNCRYRVDRRWREIGEELVAKYADGAVALLKTITERWQRVPQPNGYLPELTAVSC